MDILLNQIESIVSLETSANTPEFILAFIITIILSLTLKGFYQYGLENRNFSDNQLSNSVVIIMVTTFVVVYIVKSSLTLSLGLVGALSIVRFRTPIKDPLELSVLFVAIGVGISLAVFQYSIALILTTFASIYFIILKKFDGSNESSFLTKVFFLKNIINIEKFTLEIQSENKVDLNLIIANLTKKNIDCKLVSSSSSEKTQNANIILFSKNPADLLSLNADLKVVFEDCSFYLNRI